MLDTPMTVAQKLSLRAELLQAPGVLSWVVLSCVGFVFWLVTYVLAMKYGHDKKSYAIPAPAVCLNFSWELLASFVWDMRFALWHIGCLLWLLLDVGVVYQVFRHGARVQLIPELRDNFRPLLLVTFLLGLAGQHAFTLWSGDDLGIVDSYIINLVMSVSFIFMYFNRREHDGLSYAIAWCKMLGTGIVSVTMIPLFPRIYPGVNANIMWVLCPLVLMVDCVYIGILARARRMAARTENKGELSSPSPRAAHAAA